MTAKQGTQRFGANNIITIVLILSGMLVSYTMLSAKVDYISDRLEEEKIERVLEDGKIRLEMNSYYVRHDQQQVEILKALEDIREDLTYHLGKHAGEEELANK